MKGLSLLTVVALVGCASSTAGHTTRASRSLEKRALSGPIETETSRSLRCTAPSTPCPIETAVSITVDRTASLTNMALGADGTGFVALRWSTSGAEAVPGGRGQILEIDREGGVTGYEDLLPGSMVKTDTAGNPIVISRPFAAVLHVHGWLDGSYPRTLGPWPRHVLDVDIRGVERLAILDTRLDAEGAPMVLLGHSQSSGQFPLLLAHALPTPGGHVEVVDPKPYGGAAALDVMPDGRPYIVHTTLSGTTEDATLDLVAGPVGTPPVTVHQRSFREFRVDAVRVLAPTDTEGAILSLVTRGELHLARVDDGQPRTRELPELRTVEHDSIPPISGPVRYTNSHPDQHVLLRNDHGAFIAWLAQDYEYEQSCSEVTTEVGPIMGCDIADNQSRAVVKLAPILDDLALGPITTLQFSSMGVSTLVGDARGERIALASMRWNSERGPEGPAELDYVVLTTR